MDIDKRAFVTAIGIDVSEDPEKKYKVTVKISLSKGEPSTTGSEFAVISSDADSLSEAFKIMKSMTDKELFYGQTKSILIGEKVATEEIRPVLNYFVRRADIQRTAYLGIASPDAFQVLNFKGSEEQVAGNYLFSIFEEISTESPYVIAVTLFDAYRRETESGITIAMPIMEIQNKRIKVDKIALFSKSGMEATLNPKEAELYKLLTDGIKNSSIIVNNQEQEYSINILRSRAQFKLQEEEGNLVSAIFHIKIKASIEENLDDHTILSYEQIKKMEDETEKKIRSEVHSLLDTIQKTKLDPLGIGLKFNSSNFNHRDINDFYSNLRLKIKVDCRIKKAGILK